MLHLCFLNKVMSIWKDNLHLRIPTPLIAQATPPHTAVIWAAADAGTSQAFAHTHHASQDYRQGTNSELLPVPQALAVFFWAALKISCTSPAHATHPPQSSEIGTEICCLLLPHYCITYRCSITRALEKNHHSGNISKVKCHHRIRCSIAN